jgi:hypothetical protein
MNELEQVWSSMLARAQAEAAAAGRRDVAEYLSLKAANDVVRRAGVQWLFDSFIELGGIAGRQGTALVIERVDPYRFPYNGAHMVGSLLEFRRGVRRLIVEAGWARTPADGFLRGGGLAAARIRHFGVPGLTVESVLEKREGPPAWIVRSGPDIGAELTAQVIEHHFRTFIES